MALFEIGVANLLGIAVYLASAAVAIATAVAAQKAIPRRSTFWIAVCAVFLGLAAVRLAGAEEAIRQALRGYLIEQREYGGRHLVQAGAVLATLAACAIGIVLLLPRVLRWPLWQILVSGSLAFLTLLYVVRIISLHAVDRLLYAGVGPLRFHYVLELLPIAAIWYAAWLFRQHGPDARAGRARRPSSTRQ